MSQIETAFFEIGSLDTLATRDSFIHRLDPRAKLLTTLAFIFCVVSFDKYQFSSLLPLVIFPASQLVVGRLPVNFLWKKLLFLAPFVVLIGIFNPFFDRQILFHIGPFGVSGGWMSFASILLRSALTISAALILIATTSFSGVCLALEKIGAPRVFVLQLLFLYRYLFVLGNEGTRLVRARTLRSFNRQGTGMAVFAQLAGQLLLRTLDRAQRIHLAMRCRAFSGEIHLLRSFNFGRREFLFMICWCSTFLLIRAGNFPQLLGKVLLEFTR